MIRRRGFALAMAGALAFGNACAMPAVYVELDGHWYPANSGPVIWFFNGYGYFMPAASMTLCARADGQPQALGDPGFYYSPFFYPVYRVVSFQYRDIPGGAVAFSYATAPGNIICAGEIPSPIPDAVFSSGFEVSVPADRVFSDGFDAR